MSKATRRRKTCDVSMDFLEPAFGYFDLGMYQDAESHIEGLTKQQKAHPQVTALRLKILVAKEDYEAAIFYGNAI